MNHLDRRKSPEIRSFEHLSMPEVRHITLDNGIPLTIYNAKTLDVCRLSMIWDGGICESERPSIAILTANSLREGTSALKGSQIAEKFEFNGAWLKSSISPHHSTVVMYSLNSKLSEVLPLLAEITSNPSFPEHEVNVLKQKMAASTRIQQEKVESLCTKSNNRLIFGADHPMSRYDQPVDIESITISEIKSQFNRVFVPSGLGLYLSGHVTTEMERLINKTFGRIETDKPSCGLNIIPLNPSDTKKEIVHKSDALQSALIISIPTINRDHEDYITLRMAVMALGGYFGSRLMANIREDKGYTYGITSSLLGYREGGVIEISTQCDNKYVDAIIHEVEKEITRIKTGDMSHDEIDRLKNYLMTSLASKLDSPFSIMDYYENMRVVGVDRDNFDRQIKTVKCLTNDLIAQVATRYLDLNNMYISVAGNLPLKNK